MVREIEQNLGSHALSMITESQIFGNFKCQNFQESLKKINLRSGLRQSETDTNLEKTHALSMKKKMCTSITHKTRDRQKQIYSRSTNNKRF